MNKKDAKMAFRLLKPKQPLLRWEALPFLLTYPWIILLVMFMPVPIWLPQILPVFFLIFEAITFLLSYWSVNLKAKIRFNPAADLRETTHVLVTKHFRKENRDRTALCELVHKIQTEDEGRPKLIQFVEYYKQKYVYEPETATFVKVKQEFEFSFETYRTSLGMSSPEILAKTIAKYGNNTMDIPMPKFMELFKEHVVAPFFVFQIFCTMLWMLEEYWYFSVISFVMLFVFESGVIFSRLKNMERIRGMRIRHRNLKVYREGRWTDINSEKLVPGDIVCLEYKPGADLDNKLPCDMLLLSGACTVNESILTGESVPQTKEPIVTRDNMAEKFSLKSGQHKAHILFGRTEILHCFRDMGKPLGLNVPAPPVQQCCLAYVLRTGFDTTQGKLVRTVLFTAERVTVESKESYFFLLLLLFFAMIAAIYTLVQGLKDPERNKYKVVVKSILILAAVVPPELPMELSMAVNTSIISLIRGGIFCTEPYRIPMAGKITTCCFDKTGTLTSDKVRINGVVDSTGKVRTIEDLRADPVLTDPIYVIGLCHSISMMADNKTILGDPLEKLAFEQLGWKFDSARDLATSADGRAEGMIVAKYPFSSLLKRMSVLAQIRTVQPSQDVLERHPAGRREFCKILSKGAPEVIRGMLKEVPTGFDALVKEYTRQGARVLALAYRDVESTQKIPREEAEKDLNFCGFMITSCPLKKDSKRQVEQLLESKHQVVIITGDNQFTATHVAKELGMVRPSGMLFVRKANSVLELVDPDDKVILSTSDPARIVDVKQSLCMNGEALSMVDTGMGWSEKQKADVVSRVSVFARVSPSQKDYVIGLLNQKGEVTLMCGDGTNDVGSLKRAHVGIALLNKEETQEEKKRNESLFMKAMNDQLVVDGDASIAAPFTYRYDSVKCVCNIIRQGRCTLVTTIQMYKILALNCLMLAYSLSVLYQQGLKSGDVQSTIFAIPIAVYFFFISRATPLEQLRPFKPPGSIFALSQIGCVAVQFVTHITGLIFLTQLSMKYTPATDLVKPDGTFKPSMLNTVIMIYLSYVDATNFFINYDGEPFMEPLWKSSVLPKVLVLHMVGLVVAALDISPDLRWLLELHALPEDFPNYAVIGTMALDFAICFSTQHVIRKKLYG